MWPAAGTVTVPNRFLYVEPRKRLSVWSGSALVAMSQSVTGRPRSKSRTPPPTRYAAWPLFQSVSMMCSTSAGTSRGAARSMAPMRGLVAPDEEVVAPGLVTRVREVRGEQRVHVTARLEGRPRKPHPRLVGEPPALSVVAVLARCNQVVPRVRAAAVTRNDVVQGQIVRLRAAVLARVLVAEEDLAPAESHPRARPLYAVLQPNDRRRPKDLRGRADVVMVVLDDLCLLAEDESKRPSDIADVEGLVIRVKKQYDAIHIP